MNNPVKMKSEFNKPKNKDIVIVFRNEKKERRTEFCIFSDRTIELRGPSCNNGLHIPSRLYNWYLLPQKKEKKPVYARANITIRSTKNQLKRFNNICCKIYHNSYEGYILPLEQEKCFEAIKGALMTKSQLYIIIPGYVDEQCQLSVKNLFYSASQLVRTTNLQGISNSKLMVYFHHRNQKVAIHRDQDGEIYIKINARISESGEVQLTKYLAYFIKDWFEKEELFLASKGHEHPIVVPSIIRKRRDRGGRLCKILNFPYWGNSKNIEVILSRPKLQLTLQAKLNYQLRCLLQKAKCSIKGLMANTWNVEIHKQKEFAITVKSLLSDIFLDNKNTKKASEVVLNFDSRVHIIPKATNHCFDNLVNTETKKNISIYLFEIISSFNCHKNRAIITEIASLTHFLKKMGTNCMGILFINGELTGNKKRVITDYYGLNSGVLVIGTSILNNIIATPQLFLRKISSFQEKQKQLSRNSNMLVNPHTNEIVPKNQLEKEALDILISIVDKKQTKRLAVANYCYVMGLTVNDFHLLYKEGLKVQNSQMLNNLISMFELNNELYTEIICNKENNDLCALLYIHSQLIINGSISLLSIKPTLRNFIPYQQFLREILPINVRIIGTQKPQNKGVDFEKVIKDQLEDEGFTIVPNVVFYYSGRTFEVDLIGLKERELLLISCKNMSSTTSSSQAEENIKDAANILAFRKEILNASYARLYVKPNLDNKEELLEVFQLGFWTDKIKIILSENKI